MVFFTKMSFFPPGEEIVVLQVKILVWMEQKGEQEREERRIVGPQEYTIVSVKVWDHWP